MSQRRRAAPGGRPPGHSPTHSGFDSSSTSSLNQFVEFESLEPRDHHHVPGFERLRRLFNVHSVTFTAGMLMLDAVSLIVIRLMPVYTEHSVHVVGIPSLMVSWLVDRVDAWRNTNRNPMCKSGSKSDRES